MAAGTVLTMTVLLATPPAGQEPLTADFGPFAGDPPTELHLRIEERHRWAQGAAADARYRAQVLEAALEQMPVSVEAVTVEPLHLEPILEEALLPSRARAPRESEVVGYRAVLPVTVVLPDAGALDMVAGTAAGAGADVRAGWGTWQEPRSGSEGDEDGDGELPGRFDSGG